MKMFPNYDLTNIFYHYEYLSANALIDQIFKIIQEYEQNQKEYIEHQKNLSVKKIIIFFF